MCSPTTSEKASSDARAGGASATDSQDNLSLATDSTYATAGPAPASDGQVVAADAPPPSTTAPSEGGSSSNPSHPVVGQDLYVDLADHSEYDSALGDDDAISYTTSLSSSVMDYRYQYGRRYHAFDEDQYMLPNDEQETERLDIQHHVWSLTLNGGLHISPLGDNVRDVIDLGTGTGGWAIEFADLHPEAQVVGTDLSPIQPTWTPPNCSFICDNVEQDWVYNRKFDFVHSRMLLMGVKDWPRYFEQAWEYLRPGGFVEVEEVQFPLAYAADDSVPADSPLLLWSKRVQEASAKTGIDTLVSNKFPEMIAKQGFVNIREKWPKWAVGPWPKGKQEKEIGWWTLENTKQILSAISLSMWTKYLGWTAEEVELELVNVRRELEDRSRHYYWQMCIISAQKPLDAKA